MAEELTAEETEKSKHEWVSLKPHEMEKIILELHKEGKTPAQIGLLLRDKHGIPKTRVILGKRISEILFANKLEIPSEKSRVEKRTKILETHLHKHKHDYTAKRSLMKKQWLVNKFVNAS